MATSTIAASRLVARNISQTGYAANQERFAAWIDSKADSAVASDALVGALGFSKDADKVLGEAQRIYTAAIANGDDAGGGIGQAAVEDLIEAKTATLASKFRGTWAPGELVWSDDFSGGFAPSSSGVWSVTSGSPGALAMGAADDRNANPPAYANLLNIASSEVVLHLNRITELTGKTISSISFYNAQSAGVTTMTQGGVQKFFRNPGAFPAWSAWERDTVDLTTKGDLIFASVGNIGYLTGIEISAVTAPYMIGDFVLYKGLMWKSKSNNNGTTPGASSSWEQIPVSTLLGGPDRAPGAPNPKDDEFDGTSSASWANTPTAPTTWDVSNDRLYLRANGAGVAMAGKLQSVPAFPFTATTKVVGTNLRTGSSFFGLVATPASPSGASPCCTLGTCISAGSIYGQRLLFSAMAGNAYVSGATEDGLTGAPHLGRYYRWTFNSATSITAEVSQDGIHWRTIETAFNPGFSVGKVGLMVCENGTPDLEAMFEFFRIAPA